ncbi:MAG: hypothetical protein RL477_1570 [Pseudomonadota bacterium]|jgi:YaiO family outer membrane protein
MTWRSDLKVAFCGWVTAVFLLVAGTLGPGAAGAQATPDIGAPPDIKDSLRRADDALRAGRFDGAIEILARLRNRRPDDPEILYRLGRALAFAGRYDESLAVLDRAAILRPNDMDIRLAIAQTDFWGGRIEAAERSLAPVLAAAPDNPDALMLKGRLLFARQIPAAAETLFLRVLALRPGDRDAMIALADVLMAQGKARPARDLYREALAADASDRALRGRLSEAEKAASSWEADLSGGYSGFARRDAAEWHEEHVALSYRLEQGLRLGGRLENYSRFRRDDQTFKITGAHGVSPAFGYGFFAGATPDADFRPRFTAGVDSSARLLQRSAFGLPALVGLAEGVFDHYASGDVRTLRIGLEQNLSDRLSLTAMTIQVLGQDDRWRDGWLVRARAAVAEGVAATIGGSVAPETENSTTSNNRSIFAGISWDIDPRTTVRLDILREDRERSYIRNAITLGLRRRF